MISPFAWLRRKCAEAVVLGVSDGLQAVAPEGDEPAADLDELRQQLAAVVAPKQLAAGEDEGAERKGRKR